MESSQWPNSGASYDLDTPIGFGAFGLVWKAVVNCGAHAGSAVAIKIIDLDQYPDNSIDEIRKEYTIVMVTHSMQQAARVSQYTAFLHLGHLV